MNRAALDSDPGRLHLHSGAARQADDVVLVAAPSGGGKSTTVTALARAGFDYLTDEMVTLDPASAAISTFPKPLSIKNTGFGPFTHLIGPALPAGYERTDSNWTIPATNLGLSVGRGGEPSLIVLLEPPEHGPSQPAPVTAASAIIALIEQSMDFDRFGPTGLEVFGRLCARTPAVSIGRAAPDVMANSIAAAIESTPLPGLQVNTLSLPNSGPIGGLEALYIGDEAVVRNLSTGRLGVLSEVGADLLLQLDETCYQFAPLSGAALTFATELRDAELIANEHSQRVDHE